MAKLRKAGRPVPPYVLDGRKFRLSKNESCSFSQCLAIGDYADVHNVIIEPHFPECGNMIFDSDFHLAVFSDDVHFEHALPIFENVGLILGELDHLNVLNALYPELLNEGPIIAPGSAWHDYRVAMRDGVPSPTITTFQRPTAGNYKTLYAFAEHHVINGRRLALCAYIQKQTPKTRFLVYRQP